MADPTTPNTPPASEGIPVDDDLPQPTENTKPVSNPGEKTDATTAGPAPRGQANTQQAFPVFKPLKDPWNDDEIIYAPPSEVSSRLEEAFEGMDENEKKDLVIDPQWNLALQAGLNHSPDMDFYAKLSEREKAVWCQAVEFAGRLLGISKPRIGEADNAVLRGEQALARMRAYMGLGGTFRIPLWHSGFWITIGTPGESAQIALDRQISEEKLSLGRATSGMMYSNGSVFLVEAIVQFFLDHKVSTTLKDESVDLMDRISIHDIQTLAWGLACSIYPDGFQYARAILGKTPAENRTELGLIDVAKLQWTDTGALTERQISHMANITTGAMTNESIELYRQEFKDRLERRVPVSDKMTINLTAPTVRQHITAGQVWINDIVTTTDRAFGINQDPKTRDNYIWRQGLASVLRQYRHWIKSIELGGAMVDHPETVDRMLNELSSLDPVREKIVEAVMSFAQDSTVSYIAVPTVDEREEKHLPHAPHLLPIDALTTFFTLLKQKLQKVMTR